MNQQEPPKIEFPCANYPVKVVGVHSDDYLEVVYAIVRKHDPSCVRETVRMRESSKGGFLSCTLYITATGTQQLTRLHEELMTHPYVRMVI